jgi:hypothetical protein
MSQLIVDTYTDTITITALGATNTPQDVSVTIFATPPLSVSPSSLDFETVQVGSSKNLTFEVTNKGGDTLTGSVTTSFPFSIDDPGGSFGLEPEASHTVTVNFSPTGADTFLNLVNIISNGGSANVLLTGVSTHDPLLKPDLVISKITVTPDSAQPGEELTVLATVLNNGQTEAGPFRVGVYLSNDELVSIVDEEMGSWDFAGLPFGALESEDNVCTLSLILPEDLTPRTSIYIGAIADDEFAVEESSEGNNIEYVKVTIEKGCPAEAVLEGDPQRNTKLEILYAFRDEVLASTSTGQRYIELFYKHAEEGLWLMLSYPELLSYTRTLLERFLPTIQAILAGQLTMMTSADVADVEVLLEAFAAKASPKLQADLRAIQEELQQGTLLEQFGIRIDHEVR